MQLVERHVVNSNHKYFAEIDNLSFLSKNLYNAANYIIRQEFIRNSKYQSYNTIQKLMQSQVDYKALPAKVSQQVLILLDKNWKSFFEATKSYNNDPSKFLGKPKLPKYKDKIKGRNLLIYTVQAVSKSKLLKYSIINPSKSKIQIKTSIDYLSINQVKIIPKLNHYIIEVIYNSLPTNLELEQNNIASIDLGLNNLITLTSNIKKFKPVVINGKPLKSINQFFNKTKARFNSKIKVGTTKRIQRLCSKRSFKVDDYLHKASRLVIDFLINQNIGTLIIGKNNNWKQECNLGKRNNQNFVQIPHSRLIHQLTYKAELVGIKVIITEESYTSKASFLDLDTIPTYKKEVKHIFSGKRIQRGMYRSKSGRLINADVNASYNIMRKAVPNAFVEGIEGVVVHPVRFKLTN